MGKSERVGASSPGSEAISIEREAPRAFADPPPGVARVIIVSEDGLRPDALVAAGARVHARLIAEGAFSAQARTTARASTLPGHAAMLSGFDESRHGLTWNSWKPDRGFIRVPTVFSAAAQAGKGTAAFVGKLKLAHIVRPDRVDIFSRPHYLCRKVVEEAAAYFVSKKPAVQFVHFSDPDAEGHKNGWMSPEQLEAVRTADGCLGTLVEAIERAGLAEETLLLVSADHGGHGMGHSGDNNEADRRIPWLAWGAGVRKGHRLVREIATMDTAATALWALGLPQPEGAAGSPVTEAFASRKAPREGRAGLIKRYGEGEPVLPVVGPGQPGEGARGLEPQGGARTL